MIYYSGFQFNKIFYPLFINKKNEKKIIKLECGYDVEVIAIEISRTSEEFLAGEPCSEDNIYM
jgi:hypothetical protein